ncbi:MAG: shikimate kinase AroK [Gammaproteobacteria bacterium]|nr:MAG: shikimate kinase AroK [Gammaproteobacteria bacterium]
MESGRNLFLVGLMGAGKTTVGRRLAKALGRPFFDSDRVIEERTGVSIPLIFELEGEEGFRRREKAVIDELTQKRGIVLATGGGAVLDEDNRRRLAERGKVIYLYAPVPVLLRRTERDRNRPLLQTSDRRARLKALFEMRDPLYREIADVIVETGSWKAQRVVRAILERC